MAEVKSLPGTLEDIPNEFSGSFLPYEPSLRQKQRAHAFSKGAYLHSLNIFPSADKVSLAANIYASQKKSDAPHKVNVEIDVGKSCVCDAHCSCKAGISGRCSHVLALIKIIEDWKIAGYKDVPGQPSCTSLPQQWDKPRGTKIESEPVSQMIIAKPGNLSRKRRPVMATFIDNRKIQITDRDFGLLQSLKDCPISYLTSNPSTETVDTPIGPQFVGSVLGYHAPLLVPLYTPREKDPCGDINFPKQIPVTNADQILQDARDSWCDLNLSQEQCQRLEKQTRGQHRSQDWYNARKLRITASSFGAIMKRKRPITDVFLKNLFDKKPFTSKPTSYGQMNEKIAKQMYIRKTKRHLHDVGLVVNSSCPFLGATPDALVCDNEVTGIVEVKCPYGARDMTIEQACIQRNDFFLEKNGDTYNLKQDHEHWFQVQGQLLVTGAPFCDFVTFTRPDFNIERILPHMDTMSELLEHLLNVYINHMKPYVTNKISSN